MGDVERKNHRSTGAGVSDWGSLNGRSAPTSATMTAARAVLRRLLTRICASRVWLSACSILELVLFEQCPCCDSVSRDTMKGLPVVGR